MPTRNFLFDQVKVKKPRYNVFNMSFSNKLTLPFGGIIPVLCKEVIPGDKWRCDANIRMRLMPMLAPVMHNCDAYIHFWYWPYRLGWKNCYEFITGGPEGTSEIAFPTFSTDSFFLHDQEHPEYGLGEVGTLADYLGVPQIPGTDNVELLSLLPFKAYQDIYNNYYRDQNYIDEVPIFADYDGVHDLSEVYEYPDSTPQNPKTTTIGEALFTLRQRAWEKDYFTSALPFAQRGPSVGVGSQDPVNIILDKTAGFQRIISQNNIGVNSGNVTIQNDSENWSYGQGTQLGSQAGALGIRNFANDGSLGNLQNVWFDPNQTLKIGGSVFTINDLRQSMRLQEWLEKNARSGGRYVEQLLSHFGVVGDDLRIGRPQYLGGGVQPIVMSEVTQTSSNDGEQVLGSWAGNGFSFGSANGWEHYFKEHGLVMATLSVIPRSGYHQGIPKMYSRQDKFDFFWPEFAHLGEQDIKMKEVYFDGNITAYGSNNTFGYTPRYAEYKFSFDEVHGEMKTTMEHWHLNRSFASQPVNGANFINVTPEQCNRIFAVTDAEGSDHKIIAEVDFRISKLSMMPKFGTPTF